MTRSRNWLIQTVLEGMGTTVTAAMFDGSNLVSRTSDNSRADLFRDGRLERADA